jgi:adenine-specific DNA-methyltransferase
MPAKKKSLHGFSSDSSLFSAQLPEGAIRESFDASAQATVFLGDRLELLSQIADESAMLIATSPPYNIGKKYERRLELPRYLEDQDKTIAECIRTLHPRGSICWQVGNHVDDGEVFPLDILLYDSFKKRGLKMRNRIVWHFEHGLHCARRFSGRYETIIWFTKSDDYVFNLDSVRVPQKYPGKKYFKGPKAGEYSCNPLGKNPGDLWVIPNVKHNHVEKTIHPCQFPVELIERLVLAFTNEGDLVFDPYLGVGTAICAAVINGRRGAGSDVSEEYVGIARERVKLAIAGDLRTRKLGTEVYKPTGKCSVSQPPPDWINAD